MVKESISSFSMSFHELAQHPLSNNNHYHYRQLKSPTPAPAAKIASHNIPKSWHQSKNSRKRGHLMKFAKFPLYHFTLPNIPLKVGVRSVSIKKYRIILHQWSVYFGPKQPLCIHIERWNKKKHVWVCVITLYCIVMQLLLLVVVVVAVVTLLTVRSCRLIHLYIYMSPTSTFNFHGWWIIFFTAPSRPTMS